MAEWDGKASSLDITDRSGSSPRMTDRVKNPSCFQATISTENGGDFPAEEISGEENLTFVELCFFTAA